MTKIFEIRKAGFLNQGAAMMLIAATRELKHVFPYAIIAIAPDASTPFQPRAELGLWHRAKLEKLGIDLGGIVNIVPKRLRHRYGFITESEVDVVIDAAGLAYSDQWGAVHTQNLAKCARRWNKQGKRLILLPQALGPFTSPQIRTAISEVADHATLIYARDGISYKHITEAVGKRDNIRLGPDFTNLLEGYVPNDFDLSGHLVALVPNYRMLDKSVSDEKLGYVPLIQNCARKLLDAGMTPFFLIHEGPEDYRLGEIINTGLNEVLPIIQYDDPLATKGVLGRCHGVVSSRFHALVSALSQGVPCLGTGWNHKYQALFADYDCPQALLSSSMSDDELDKKLQLICNDETHLALVKTLKSKSNSLKEETKTMWKQVFTTLENGEISQ
jgi:colanic acid/amylovoran biosynthesis protein